MDALLRAIPSRLLHGVEALVLVRRGGRRTHELRQPEAAFASRHDVAALCGRPRGAAQRNGRVVSPPGSAKKKRRQRKLKPFAGRPRNASRMRQLYP